MALNSTNSIWRGDRQFHRFLVLRKLGQGTYGKVQLALNKETNEEVAVKTIKKGKIENKEEMLRIRREIHIMSSIRHPHIIHINEVFETRQKIVIVMQYASGGELYDYLGCHHILPEDEARRIFRQIASAIYYCHKNQICHRDLKLENILLDEEGNAQIADFGLSNQFDETHRMNTFCGSPLYASPEIVKGTPYKGPEVDCWSLGVLLYTLVYGTMPFNGRSFKELVSQITEGRYEEPVNKSSASCLIRRLLTPDVSRRATVTDVCADPWINEGYAHSLLEMAQKMATSAGLPHKETNAAPLCKQVQTNAISLCLEKDTKNGLGQTMFKNFQNKEITSKLSSTFTNNLDNASKLSSTFTNNLDNASKLSSAFTHNLDNAGGKTDDPNFQTQASNLYEQILNYDVRFVLNKLITAVETSMHIDLNARKFTKAQVRSMQNNDCASEKVDSAYVIPIFEVTSSIPNVKETQLSENCFKEVSQNKWIHRMFPKVNSTNPENESSAQAQIITKENEIVINKMFDVPGKGQTSNQIEPSTLGGGSPHNPILLTNSQKNNSLFGVPGPVTNHKNGKQQKSTIMPPQKTKQTNDNFPLIQKLPNTFMRTKNHVLNLARLLSLNCEKLKQNSFRMSKGKKKPPGKITIPSTFNSSASIMKLPKEKKELFIIPTVSVSENKKKIQNKIEKFKKAALNKNRIIRSDSKTRLRIENYIRSQVKRIQDLVNADETSIHASFENLDEQSLRDVSEMYYRAFGSENTDSGIANAEDDESFCFLCSKPNDASRNSSILDSIQNGCLYTSTHLHIPRKKNLHDWSCSSNNNKELGTLTRCRSEIQFPIQYLNYISSDKSELTKRTFQKQEIQNNNIDLSKYFRTTPPSAKSFNFNTGILRSASDTIGLNFNNIFEVVKLNIDDSCNILENCSTMHHLFQNTSPSSTCDASEITDRYETQSSATEVEHTLSVNNSSMLEKDDGIGDSNDSFQSYIETLQCNAGLNPEITRSKSSHSYMNCLDNRSKFLTEELYSGPYLNHKRDDINFGTQSRENGANAILPSDILTWATIRNDGKGLIEQEYKNKGLRRRNTMPCVRNAIHRDDQLRLDPTSSEFEHYLWNTYNEHLLQSAERGAEFLNSPHTKCYYPDRKANYKSTDHQSSNYINGENRNDFSSLNFPNFMYTSDQCVNDLHFKDIFMQPNNSKIQSRGFIKSLGRTKSIGSQVDNDDIIQKLRAERRLSQDSNIHDTKHSMRTPFQSDFLNKWEKTDQVKNADNRTNRRPITKNILPKSKASKLEYKKSFLQLLALKRIQEAEKELDKSHRNDLPEVQEDNSGSLLEALKNHGYKSVISQRFQDVDDDYVQSYHTKYSKSPRQLRAELARLNYMYYESLPRYSLDSYEDTDYFYPNLDYTTGMKNEFAVPPFYDLQKELSQKTPKQSVYDWLNTIQADDYSNTLRFDTAYTPEETTPIPGKRKCCTQRTKDLSLEDESISESQDTVENQTPNCNGLWKENELDKPIYHAATEDLESTEEEGQESVRDRIWRKSFYSRFNNRIRSRKGNTSYGESEFASENRLGQLSSIFTPSPKGLERYDWGGSSTSAQTKKLRKHSASFETLRTSSRSSPRSDSRLLEESNKRYSSTKCDETPTMQEQLDP